METATRHAGRDTRADARTPAITIRAVHQTFRGPTETVHAVRGISLTIRRGEIVALLGPNGAGKTTLLDMVLGFATPTQGAIEVLGTTPEQAVRDGHIAALLQTGGLLGSRPSVSWDREDGGCEPGRGRPHGAVQRLALIRERWAGRPPTASTVRIRASRPRTPPEE